MYNQPQYPVGTTGLGMNNTYLNPAPIAIPNVLPEVQANGNYIDDCIKNELTQNSTKNEIRQKSLEFFGANNWQNQQYQDHFLLVSWMANDFYSQQGKPFDRAVNEAVGILNPLSMGLVAQYIKNLGYRLNPDLDRVGYEALNDYDRYRASIFSRYRGGYQNNQYGFGQPMPQPASYGYNQQQPVNNRFASMASGGVNNSTNVQPAMQRKRSMPAPQQTTQAQPQAAAKPVTTENTTPKKLSWDPIKFSGYHPKLFDSRKQYIAIEPDGSKFKEVVYDMKYEDHKLPTARIEYIKNLVEKDEDKRTDLLSEYVNLESSIKPEKPWVPIFTQTADDRPYFEYGFSVKDLINYSEYVTEVKDLNGSEDKNEFCLTSFAFIKAFKNLNREEKSLLTMLCRSGYEAVSSFMKSTVTKPNISEKFWTSVDRYLTNKLNHIIHTRMGIKDLSIDSFSADYEDLVKHVRKNYGDLYASRLIDVRYCLIIPELHDHINDELMVKKGIFDYIYPWGENKSSEILEEGSKEPIYQIENTESGATLDSTGGILEFVKLAVTNVKSAALGITLEVGEFGKLHENIDKETRAMFESIFTISTKSWSEMTTVYIVTDDSVVYSVYRSLIDPNVLLVERMA